jgi:hypothetical protein
MGVFSFIACKTLHKRSAVDTEKPLQEIRNYNASVLLERFPDDEFIVMEYCLYSPFERSVFSQEQIKSFIGEYAGTILRTGLQENWQAFDSRKLPVGTKIYYRKGIPDKPIIRLGRFCIGTEKSSYSYSEFRLIAETADGYVLYQQIPDIENYGIFYD